MTPVDEADGEVPQLARILRRENDDWASPKRHGLGEAKTVLRLVAGALDWIPIKLHS
jgi:hypothetical protein